MTSAIILSNFQSLANNTMLEILNTDEANQKYSLLKVSALCAFVGGILINEFVKYLKQPIKKTWKEGCYEATFTDKNEKYEVVLKDKSTGKISVQLGNYKSQQIKELFLSHLSRCKFTYFNGRCYFFVPHEVAFKETKDYKIFLIENEDTSEVFFKILDKKTCKTYWTVGDAVNGMEECSKISIDLFKTFTKGFNEETEKLFDKVNLANVEIDEKTKMVSKIIFCPAFQGKSYIDPNVVVSSTKWATTIVLWGKCSSKYEPGQHHAQMFIEGIENDKHFLHRCDYGDKGVNFFDGRYVDNVELLMKIERRSEMIFGSPIDFEKMILEIHQEKLDDKFYKKFSLYGSNGLLASSENNNCITWILNKYKKFINYKVEWSWLSFAITLPHSFVSDKNSFKESKEVYEKL